MSGNCFDSLVTSPPYNCGKDYGTTDDDLSLVEYWAWIESVLAESAHHMMPHGFLCVNHASYIGSRKCRVFVPDELMPIMSRIVPFVDWIIWDKGPARGAAWGNFRTAPRIRAQHENIFVNGGVIQMPPSDIDWSDWSRFTTSIWRVPTNGVDASIHPAMMPVEIARRLALLYTPEAGTVFDPFVGSGTTAIACLRTGRRFIGSEIDPRHFKTAVGRVKVELSQPKLFRHGAITGEQSAMFVGKEAT